MPPTFESVSKLLNQVNKERDQLKVDALIAIRDQKSAVAINKRRDAKSVKAKELAKQLEPLRPAPPAPGR